MTVYSTRPALGRSRGIHSHGHPVRETFVSQQKTTEQNWIVCTGKSEGEVTNTKNCTRGIVLLKLTTDRHEASRGLFATSDLLRWKLTVKDKFTDIFRSYWYYCHTVPLRSTWICTLVYKFETNCRPHRSSACSFWACPVLLGEFPGPGSPQTAWHVHTINNNIQDNIYGAVIMAEPLREFTRFICWM